jgi:hypothetical protein
MDPATELETLLGGYKFWEATDMATVTELFTARSATRAAAQPPYRIALRTELVTRYRHVPAPFSPATLLPQAYIAPTQRVAVVASEGGCVTGEADARGEWTAVTPHATIQHPFYAAETLGVAHTLLQEYADAQALIRQITTTTPPLSDSPWSHRCWELLGYLRRRSSELEAIFLTAAQAWQRRRHLLRGA